MLPLLRSPYMALHCQEIWEEYAKAQRGRAKTVQQLSSLAPNPQPASQSKTLQTTPSHHVPPPLPPCHLDRAHLFSPDSLDIHLPLTSPSLQGKSPYPPPQSNCPPPIMPSTPPGLPSKHPGDSVYSKESTEVSQTHGQGFYGIERLARAQRSHSKPAEQCPGCTYACTLAFPPGEAQLGEMLQQGGSSQSTGAMRCSFLPATVAAIYSQDIRVSFLQSRAGRSLGVCRVIPRGTGRVRAERQAKMPRPEHKVDPGHHPRPTVQGRETQGKARPCPQQSPTKEGAYKLGALNQWHHHSVPRFSHQ